MREQSNDFSGPMARPDSLPVRTLVADPKGHARILLRTYGTRKALHVAQMNSQFNEYWARVLQALQG